LKVIKKVSETIHNLFSLLILLIKRDIVIERRVRINAKTYLEDHVKIYRGCSILGSSIGRGTYIGWNSILNNVTIGKFCSIAPFTEVIYGRHAIDEFVTSHPAFYSPERQAGFSFVTQSKFNEIILADAASKSSVVIGNDVWIGYGVKIIEGIVIGDGAIIGAGALVTKDVEAYGVYAGVPAKKVKSRFPPETIEGLQNIRWWDREFEWIKKNHELFDSAERLIVAAESGI